MSMHEALRGLRNKVPWLSATGPEEVKAPVQLSVAEEMEILVRLAMTKGELDKQSSTWVAVCHWAANELMKTFVEQEGATNEKAAGLRARAKALRELLSLDSQDRVIRFEDASPHIP